MIYNILAYISFFILTTIDKLGYLGVFTLMSLESAAVPVPSEIIMPFSGFLVSAGRFDLWMIVLLGTLGNVFGSLVLYYVGAYGGRAFVARWGKYILFSEKELAAAEKWFEKYGSVTAFFGRLLPIVRTYVSFPAGLARMNLGKFLFYTVLGAAPWVYLFGWLGLKLGENWQELEVYARKFDIIIGGLIIIGIVWFVWQHLNRYKYTRINSNDTNNY